jgi:hypothetical protein
VPESNRLYQVAAVGWLLAHGADAAATDHSGGTALVAAGGR